MKMNNLNRTTIYAKETSLFLKSELFADLNVLIEAAMRNEFKCCTSWIVASFSVACGTGASSCHRFKKLACQLQNT